MSNLPPLRRTLPQRDCSLSEKNDNDRCLLEEGDLSQRHVQSCHARFSAKTHLLALNSIRKQQNYAMEKQPHALSLLHQEQQEQQQEEELPFISGQCQSASNSSRKSLSLFFEQTNDDERSIDSSDIDNSDSQSQNTCNDMFDVFRWSTVTSTNKSNSLSPSSPSLSSSPSVFTKVSASASTVVVHNGMKIKSSKKSKQQRDGKAQQRKLMTSQDYFLKRQSKRSHSRVIESILPSLLQTHTSNNNNMKMTKTRNSSPVESPPAA